MRSDNVTLSQAHANFSLSSSAQLLLAKGYKFVTVSELIATDKPKSPIAKAEPTASPAPQ
jgi:hypothetical protein